MRVVVIGATGNVGTALLRTLADEPQVREVVGVARRRPDWSVPKTTWATADVTRDDLGGLLQGADAVVHLAWLIQPSRDESVPPAPKRGGGGPGFLPPPAAGGAA